MDNIIKGILYENYIHSYLVPSSKKVWLWSNIPEKVLVKSELVHDLNKHRLRGKSKSENKLRDVGIDILQYTNDKEYVFIQCKNYSSAIKVGDLAGFHMMIANNIDKKGIVYYTSSLSYNITENNKNIQYIRKTIEDKDKIRDVNEFSLYDYQEKAVSCLENYFKDNSRGILHMPCGTGKTLISCIFCKNYMQVIILSPLKCFAEQNIKRFKEYDDSFKELLIDSDGTRNIDEIKEFIETNKKNRILFSVTYKSVDVVNLFIEMLDKDNLLIIVDEFHNLTRNNLIKKEELEISDDDTEDVLDLSSDISGNSEDVLDLSSDISGNSEDDIDDFYKLLHSDYNFLFMSATPRIYDLEGDEDDNDFTEIFGKKAYHMEMFTAIKEKYICDYKIYLPSISEDRGEILKYVNTEMENDNYLLDCRDLDNDLEAKCIFFFKGMTYNGSRKCIVYLQTHKQIKDFIEMLKNLNAYYSVDLWTGRITSDDSMKKRNKTLNDFKEFKGYGIICSVHILDESIDIEECDSIYITYKSSSKIKTIQRICRANRKVKDNPRKIARIYLWCNTYDELPDFLSCLKEYDPEFKSKFRVLGLGNERKEKEDVKKDIEKLNYCFIGVKEYNRDTIFWEKYEKLKKWIEGNGKTPSQTSKNIEEKRLGIWCSRKRGDRRNGKLDEDKINKLEEISLWWWEKEDPFNNRLEELKQWINDNNRIPGTGPENIEEKRLGYWCSDKRKDKKYSKLEEDKIKLLESISIWYWKKEDPFNNRLEELKQWINDNNRIPSGMSKNIEEKRLGSWCSNKRQDKKDSKLEEDKIKQLESISIWYWEKEDPFDDRFKELKRWIEYNNKIPSDKSKNIEEKSLGYWCSDKRKDKKYSKLEEDKIKLLESISIWYWEKEDPFNIRSDELKHWVNDNNRIPSAMSKDIEEKRLGNWCSSRKEDKKKDKLDKNKIEILELLPKWYWEKEDPFDNRLEELKQWINDNNRTPSSMSKDIKEKITRGMVFS